MSSQTHIDPYREMNHYDERDEDWPSSEVFAEPRRTLWNGWVKFHAARDCGSNNVSLVENTNHRPVGDKYEYSYRCWNCGHRVDEDELLFVGGEWWKTTGWEYYRGSLDELWLPPERVLELGPAPEQDDLVQALTLTSVERQAGGVTGLQFGMQTTKECDACEKETFLLFDRKCRMCYDGEWTDRLQEIVESTESSIRKSNNSFAHMLEQHIDPFSIKNRAFTETVLWRRRESEPVPKLVEIVQCLTDDADGHREYIVADLDGKHEWRYTQEELAAQFWDTGLTTRENAVETPDGRLEELNARL